MTITAEITPRVLVSWDGTGAFTGAYDDVTDDVMASPGISISAGKDGARAIDPPAVSAAAFELLNDDGRYSQERADSPVYQLVLPGRPIKVQALIGATDHYDAHTPYDETDPYDGVGTYDLARGAIDDISQTTAIGEYRVKLDTLGVESLLVAGAVTVGVMESPRVDQCVTAILDAVGWPASQRAISVADTQLTFWWADDRDPWSALLELLAAEGPGAIYVTPENGGTFHFENRNYRTTTARSTTSQASFFDTDAGPPSAYDEHGPYDAHDYYDGRASGLWFTALSYDPGFRNLWNRATLTTRRRALQSLAVVWTYGATVALAALGSVTLIARPADPFQNAVAPVLTTDYTVSGGTVSVTLSATSGLVTFVTITATSGTPTVSGLQLRAQALTVVSETTVQNGVDASASIAKFSAIPGRNIPRVLQVDAWPEIDQANAQAVCDAWVTRYQTQRPAVTITLRNANAAHVLQMLRRSVSDRITLVERNTGLSAAVWINSIRHQIEGPNAALTTVLGCEKVEEVGGAVWDLSLWNTGVWGV